MNGENEEHRGAVHALHRLVFFSDAVFAIVLTLLALELRPPEGVENGGLMAALGHMTPHFVAFASSFGLISIFWAAHMAIMRRLTLFDWPVAWLNLVVLFTIALMPFASALIGEHGVMGEAWRVYCVVLIAASMAQCGLVLAINRDKGRLTGGALAEDIRYRLLRAASPGIAFSVGLALSLAGMPDLAFLCWLLFPPILIIDHWLFGPKKAKPAPAEADAVEA